MLPAILFTVSIYFSSFQKVFRHYWRGKKAQEQREINYQLKWIDRQQRKADRKGNKTKQNNNNNKSIDLHEKNEWKQKGGFNNSLGIWLNCFTEAKMEHLKHIPHTHTHNTHVINWIYPLNPSTRTHECYKSIIRRKHPPDNLIEASRYKLSIHWKCVWHILYGKETTDTYGDAHNAYRMNTGTFQEFISKANTRRSSQFLNKLWELCQRTHKHIRTPHRNKLIENV